MKKLKVILSLSGKEQSYSVEYDTLESLCKSVFDLTCQRGYQSDKTVLTLKDGSSYRWNEVMAHHCFAHGRISVEEFAKCQFTKDFAL